MQRWLVTGSSGQLGGWLLSALRQRSEADVLGVTRPVDAQSLRRTVEGFAPTHVVHLAAVSSPAAVAAAPDAARWVNVEAAVLLAEHAARSGAWMLLPSSDWVYDGEWEGLHAEGEVCRPSTPYGRMKLEAEERVLCTTEATIARFSLLCGLPVVGDDGSARRTTWTTVRRQLLAGAAVRGVTDELRTPLSFADAAAAVLGLAAAQFSGVVNVGGPSVLTPWQVFSALATSVGASGAVEPVVRSALDAGHERPRNVALDTSRLTTAIGSVVRTVTPATFTVPGVPSRSSGIPVQLPRSSAVQPA